MRTITNEHNAETEEFVCPKCGGKYFGAVNATKDPMEYRCHDQYGRGCKKVGSKDEMFAVVKNLIRDK